MSEAHRLFSVEDANELLPVLELELGRVARLRSDLASAIASLGGADTALGILHQGQEPPAGLEREAATLKEIAGQIAGAVERITRLGCVIKDLEAGLIDFYSLRGTEPVFLCWQFGEPAVSHWHALDGGFAGRQEIEGVEVEPPEFPN
ncbi:DUF2203 domain-containing protein [Anaeromyxobacter paludicola]|uniref:DUF2203 family protein n=1 Tax=Anaeromyxobacter paludicola TaxID=2918171 RepID=A0ABN6N692_9BACT|nr:DUF2203 domain-containing protein [Anaeromyxobacter paludicola]BDG08675.1 hypothetical protein AMPC_17880 [Anaeromyxobacter paludicola]